MSEQLYPILVSPEQFDVHRRHRMPLHAFAADDHVQVMFQLKRGAEYSFVGMFAELSSKHDPDTKPESVNMMLLHHFPEDDEWVELAFKDMYWKADSRSEPLELLVKDDLIRATGGYLLDPIQEDLDDLYDLREGLAEHQWMYPCGKQNGRRWHEPREGLILPAVGPDCTE